MSQKGEKYARRMERRVDKLEQDVAAITTEQTTQGVRISAVEDDLAVYRAAVSARELKQAAAEVKAATGLDPTTASGNIAGGCYKLGLYLDKYGSVEKAAMAYNMGEGGARSAWDNGITSTDYSKAVKEAMETWECTVNAWGGV